MSERKMGGNLFFWDWVEYLKSENLVVQVQEYFGLKYLAKDEAEQRIDKKQESTKDVDGSSKSESESEEEKSIVVTNSFWYWLFIIGTEFGDETFYASFIPFWFWNIDGAVGRRFVTVWALVMYTGQALKDVIKWPRPGPPVVKLQKKWAIEYGMPSTHAMVAISIPFSILIYTHERYQYSFAVGLSICIIWCTVICLSRLYLGMHSVLDIVVGLALAIVLMFPLIPFVDWLDYWIMNTSYSPMVILLGSILLIKLYPTSDKWTPTRGDTTLCVSVCAGIQIGAWLNFQLDYITTPMLPPPYPIIWPSHGMLGLLILRTVIGLCCILATRAIGKSISYAVMCALLGRDKTELIRSENSLENKHKIIVELCYKYFTCFIIGVSLQYLLPSVFKMLGICRPDFYTEI